MKKQYKYFKQFFFFLVLGSSTFISYAQKIPLTADMVYDEAGGGGKARFIVDEQDIAGDPASGNGGKPVNAFFPGWNQDLYYPTNLIIDLGGSYNITKVYLYAHEAPNQGYANFDFNVSSGVPFFWNEAYSGTTQKDVWNGKDVNINTRYLKISTLGRNSCLTEIVLYGTLKGDLVAQPVPTKQDQPDMDQFLGVNTVYIHPDTLHVLNAVTTIREYHPWRWNEGNKNHNAAALDKSYTGYPNSVNRWKNSYFGADFDKFYAILKKNGLTVSPILQKSLASITTNENDRPVLPGSDPFLPSSYAARADHMYQNAAHYGSTLVNPSLLKTDEERLTGLNLLNYHEDYNEQDTWWEGEKGIFHPHQYAAMLSADYDGHRSEMGKTFGMKNADPKSKMVMGGLARINIDYVKSMMAWCNDKRGGDFPADVINFHHYSHVGDEYFDGKGISPEEDNLKLRAKEAVTFRDKYLPGKEVWISEFGYSTNVNAPFNSPPIAGYSNFEVQGQWIVRAFLEMYAAGIDRAMLFMLADTNPWDNGKFATCGLTTSRKDHYIPKISWYYVYTLKNVMKGMQLLNDEVLGNVHIYSFKNKITSEAVMAVWSGTSKGVELKDYEVSVPGATSATLVSLKDKSTDGINTPLEIVNGKVKLYVSERPIFIKLNKITGTTATSSELKSYIKIHPEITDGEVVINISESHNTNDLKINIVDSKGMVKQKNVYNSGPRSIVVNLEQYPSGLYIIQVETTNGMMSQKIVKY